MKELDALMNALNEQHIPEILRLTTKVISMPKDADTPEKRQALLNKAIKSSLLREFGNNDDLRELFSDYACEIAMNALIAKLDIKAPEEPVSIKDFLKKLFEKL